MPAKRSKPRLLYVGRGWPMRTGSGTPMRMGKCLEALVRDYEVHLLVIASTQETIGVSVPEWVVRACASVTHIDPGKRVDPAYANVTSLRTTEGILSTVGKSSLPYFARGATPPVLEEIQERYAGISFEAIHVARLYMAAFVEFFLHQSEKVIPLRVLDLDDIESETRERIGRLFEDSGEAQKAAVERLEASRMAEFERRYLPLFQQVWVCSRPDAAKVRRMYGHPGVVTVPNVVRPLPRPVWKERGDPFSILFVGTLGYHPNLDAVLWFCQDILPRLRKAGKPVTVTAVGPIRWQNVTDIEKLPGVKLTGKVRTVAPWYRKADMCIVPIRAGGGTRIKILEAFGHRKPVVSTSIGAEGLEVGHRSELLLADSAEEFAAACLEVMNRPVEAAAMAERAHRWVHEHHTPKSMLAAIREARRAMFTQPELSGRSARQISPIVAEPRGSGPDTALDNTA